MKLTKDELKMILRGLDMLLSLRKLWHDSDPKDKKSWYDVEETQSLIDKIELQLQAQYDMEYCENTGKCTGCKHELDCR